MEENGEMPEFVASLPPKFRRQIKQQCGGDWRRVTCDARGGVTVHNQPQRDLVAEGLITPEPEPPPPPARPLRTTIGPRTAAVDTTGFTRVELPTVGPPKKRVARKITTPAPAPTATPAPEPAPSAPAKPNPALFAPRRPAASFKAPAPAPAATPVPATPVPATPTGPKKRSGAPRTSIEMLKRLLDLGCRFQRLPATPFAKVYYRGHLIEVLRCGDDLSREDVGVEFEKVCNELRTRGWLTTT